MWGSDEAERRCFENEPFGNGWHLDRPYFEMQLQEFVKNRNIQFYQNWQFLSAKYGKNEIILTATDSGGKINHLKSSFIVDASGRSSVVARNFGVRRRVIDRLTCYYFVLNGESAILKGQSIVEATKDGWWYMAPLNHSRIVVNFMTDSDIFRSSEKTIELSLLDSLNETKLCSRYLNVINNRLNITVQNRTSTTSVLEQPGGVNWLAVGDAVATYDPLTSYGITSAMGGGIYAATAIKKYFEGDWDAINGYFLIQQRAYNNCTELINNQYALEKRFENSMFWNRRQ